MLFRILTSNIKNNMKQHKFLRSLLAVFVAAVLMANAAAAQVPYGLFDEATGTLSLGFGSQLPKNAVKVDGNTNSFIGASLISSVEKVKKICFLKSFSDYKPTTCASWFCGCSKLVDIEGLQYLNTENVTDMSKMFSGCTTFPSIDLSHFNTSNVTNMMWMFYGCARFTSLDVSSFDTKKVTSMASMFDGCKRLTVLDLGNFNTASVTNMTEMFYNCNKMETIFVGDYWDVSSVTSSEDMFFQCDELYGGQGTKCTGGDVEYGHVDGGSANPGYLTQAGQPAYVPAIPYGYIDKKTGILTLGYGNQYPAGAARLVQVAERNTCYDVTPAYVVKKVCIDKSFYDYKPTSFAWMFYNLDKLTTIEGLQYLNTENVTDMSHMFEGCVNLQTLDLSGVTNTQNLLDASFMFYNCNNLTKIDFGKFNTESVRNMEGMFAYCEKLPELDLSGFNTGNVVDMIGMFYSCSGIKSLDLSNFNTEKLQDATAMFCLCTNLSNVVLSSFNTPNLTSMQSMFYTCSSLEKLDLSSFDTRKVTNMYGLFGGCSQLKSLNLSNFNTENAVDVSGMFFACSNLTSLDLSNFNTEKVNTMVSLFRECSKLSSLDISNFNTENVENMEMMFLGCSSLESIDLGSFDTKNVTKMSGMFYYCNNLQTIFVGDGWNTSSLISSKDMFEVCNALYGGQGTQCKGGDAIYAHVDGGRSNPGYLTKSGEKPFDITTPVSEISFDCNGLQIWSHENTIYLQNPGREINIIDANGRLVKTIQATSDRMEIPMSTAGIYIIKTGGKSQKIIIR